MATLERRNKLTLWKIFTVGDWVIVFLGLTLMLSGVAVIYSKHLSRKLFAELHSEHQTRDALHVEWSQLLLEQGAWGSNGRIERIASDELSMEIPAPESIQVITE